MSRITCFVVSMICLAACVSRPNYVLDEDSMVKVLCDVHRSEGLLELQQNNSYQSFNEDYKRNVMAAVLVENGITRAQYDSSLVWYGQNLKYLVKVYSRVQKKLDEEIQYWTDYELKSRNEFPISAVGDTVELWTINDYYVLDETRLSSTKFWELKTDSNYMASDSIIWRVHFPTIPESHYAVVSLSLNYEETEDVTESTSTMAIVKEASSVDIGCRADSTRQFKSIISSISLLKNHLSSPDCILFADSISMIRIHK